MKIIVILPCYNEEQIIKKTADVIQNILKNIKLKSKITNYEILFIDDGSNDNTWRIIEELTSDTIHGLKLSCNVGHQNALWAGYEYAQDKCDMMISIDADLQQDPNAIELMIDEFYKGSEVVYGVRNDRSTDSFFKRLTSFCFYRVINLLGGDILPNHADYRLLSNRACKALMSYTEYNIFIRGLVRTLGYKESIVHFNVSKRTCGDSKYTTLKMVNLAIDGITSFSVKPLRLIAVIGALVMIGALFATIYVFISYILGLSIPGWSSLLLSIWFLGGVQLFILGIIGEYIGKIYKEVKRRPKYHVEKII